LTQRVAQSRKRVDESIDERQKDGEGRERKVMPPPLFALVETHKRICASQNRGAPVERVVFNTTFTFDSNKFHRALIKVIIA